MATETRWTVLYTTDKTQKFRRYKDGSLIVRTETTTIQKIILIDEYGKKLEDRFLRNSDMVEDGAHLEFDRHIVAVQSLIKQEEVSSSASAMSSVCPQTQNSVKGDAKSSVHPARDLQSIYGQLSQVKVGSTWNVLYSKKNKNARRQLDGILRLEQAKSDRLKVVLCDSEGNNIEPMFLKREQDIADGTTLDFSSFSVEVVDVRREPPTAPEQRAMKGIADHQYSIEGVQACQFQSHDILAVNPNRRNVCQILSCMKRPLGCTDTTLQRKRNSFESSCRPHPPLEEGKSSMNFINESRWLVAGEKKVKSCRVEDQSLDGGGKQLGRDQPTTSENGVGVVPFTSSDPKPPASSTNTREKNDSVAEEIHRRQNVLSLNNSNSITSRKSTKPFKSPQINSNCISTTANEADREHLYQANIVFQPHATVPLTRHVIIPDKFTNLDTYKTILSSAVTEELNLILRELSARFSEARKELFKISVPRPLCKQHGPAQLKIVRKDSSNKGSLFYSCVSDACTNNVFAWTMKSGNPQRTLISEELAQGFGCYNIDFYSDCELSSRHEGAKKTALFLKLGKATHVVQHSRFDLWVISSSPTFNETRNDFVTVAVSLYHGPFNGTIELQLLGNRPPARIGKRIYALHDRLVSTEVTMLQMIRSLQTQDAPLLPLLLQCPKDPTGSVVEDTASRYEPACNKDVAFKSFLRKHLNATIEKFSLNEDQAEVLLKVSKWFSTDSSRDEKSALLKPEMCLVHGSFGSGKSFLLIVLIIFLTEVLKVLKYTNTRILVSAATNVAVDRILIGLLEQGFQDFLRVGSFDKIAKTVLPYSVHVTKGSDSEDNETERDLLQLIKTTFGSEKQKLEEELKAIKEGKMKERRETLKSVRVLGVTCHSCSNVFLKGQTFKICFLDECSQIAEPLSLGPLCRFGCTKLVAVGDPAQLPPILSGATAVREREHGDTAGRAALSKYFTSRSKPDHGESERADSVSDLGRSLFVRLVAAGYETILLRTQYRCHPRLTAMPNSMFYQGRLIDGCRDGDRPPLLQGLPHLVFCDTGSRGVEKKDYLNSFFNEFEANLASDVIKTLVARGLPCLQIGVIVFYKAQASRLQQILCPGKQVAGGTGGLLRSSERFLKSRSLPSTDGDSLADVQVSTVDAFQGMEKNIIILSCCRTGSVGHVGSPYRLNVALTRARHHLIILGKAETLQQNSLWQKLLSNVRRIPGSYKAAPDLIGELNSGPPGNTCSSEVGALDPGFKCPKERTSNDQLDEKGLIANQLENGPLKDTDFCGRSIDKSLEAVTFSVQDFWEGYKSYCFGHYSHSEIQKERFLASKMGHVICEVYGKKGSLWGAKFDETVRQVWSMMEDFLKSLYGKDCTSLRVLMEKFEIKEELAASEDGQLLLQLMKDEEHGTEGSICRQPTSNMSTTSVFDEFQDRLSRVDAGIEDLRKGSAPQQGESNESRSQGSAGAMECESTDAGGDGTSWKSRPSQSVDSDARFGKKCTVSIQPSFDLGF